MSNRRAAKRRLIARSPLNRTRFHGPEGRRAILYRVAVRSAPWFVLYEQPGLLGTGVGYRQVKAALADLSWQGFVPLVQTLHWRLKPYWEVVDGTIQARMRFDEKGGAA